ncbi:hypothetical protein [Palleronia sp. LCG004]|uniref:hypothetical protein n=1 Tax=Palleronia sp. LCG004 TaxID=3079304 RepID=UPI0029432A1B|nr:hypothetical protein [Palleronia sp. LCG004]WOI57097.1 hypothetical protein RVY76_04725 [Palleronia sp. LCG004]
MDYSWVVSNSEVINLVLQAIMVLIWVAYLQLFLFSYLRQRRPVVLINRSVGSSENARCFVSNMGAEPVHLTALVADLTIGDEVHRSFVTDRDELEKSGMSQPSEGTNQGPVAPGGFVDAGSFGEIVRRALSHIEDKDDENEVSRLSLMALCSSGYSSHIVAGARTFEIGMRDGARHFIPVEPTTLQYSSRRHQRSNYEILRKQLADERADLENPR